MNSEPGGIPLELLFARLLQRHPGMDSRAMMRLVERAVGEQLAASANPNESLEAKLHNETRELAELIHQTRMDIAALNPESITEEHLPVAGKELEAIVSATETATNDIMEAAEVIEASAEELPPEAAERISDGITKIYEACSFQDITGQRISKVVSALQQVEEKVGTMLAALGEEVQREATGEQVRRRAAERDRGRTRAEADERPAGGRGSAQSARHRRALRTSWITPKPAISPAHPAPGAAMPTSSPCSA